MFEIGSSSFRDYATYLSRAGERDESHIFMFHQRLACFAPATCDEINDTFWYAGFFKALYKVDARERSVGRRLDDSRIAADKRRHQFPARDRHREVPGRDHSADANWLTDRHGELVGHFR